MWCRWEICQRRGLRALPERCSTTTADGKAAVGSSVTPLMKAAHRVRSHGSQTFRSAKDGAAIRVEGTGPGEGLLQDPLVGLILVLRDLFKNHIPLELECLLAQRGIENQVKQQLEGQRCLIRRDQHMEMNIIKSSCSIAAAPEGFNRPVEFSCPKPLTALEHHVFEEVSHPLLTRFFRSTSSSAPKVKTGERCIRHFSCDTSHAVCQRPMRQLWAGERRDQSRLDGLFTRLVIR